MAFDPLETDEKLAEPVKRKSDLEASLMAGCSTIVAASFITYGLVIWPFFVFPEYTLKGLAMIALTGPGAATVFGIFLCRRMGISGASGFLGGSTTSAVFIYLRMQQTMLAVGSQDLPQPEYPVRWATLAPLAWFVASIFVALLFLPRNVLEHPNDA